MARQALVILFVVIAFGILVPLYKGFGFLDPRIVAAYGCLALLFVAPASAELTDGPVSAVLARIAIIVAWGWGTTVLILAAAVVTLNVALNVAARRGGFLSPPLDFLAAILIFSLTASIAVAELGAALARRFSPAQVRNILRAGFLIVLLGLAFGSRVLPQSVTLEFFDRFATRRALTHLAWQASMGFAGIAALLLLVLWRLVSSETRTEDSSAKIPMAENPDQGGR
jgi:hypothetical protein